MAPPKKLKPLVLSPEEKAFIAATAYGETGHLPESRRGLAISDKGAKGVLQIMPGTFKEIMGSMDGWDDPKKLEEAGIRYAVQQFRDFKGDPTRAAGAYVRGPTAESENRPYPGPRTKSYIPKVAAEYKRLLSKMREQQMANTSGFLKMNPKERRIRVRRANRAIQMAKSVGMKPNAADLNILKMASQADKGPITEQEMRSDRSKAVKGAIGAATVVPGLGLAAKGITSGVKAVRGARAASAAARKIAQQKAKKAAAAKAKREAARKAKEAREKANAARKAREAQGRTSAGGTVDDLVAAEAAKAAARAARKKAADAARKKAADAARKKAAQQKKLEAQRAAREAREAQGRTSAGGTVDDLVAAEAARTAARAASRRAAKPKTPPKKPPKTPPKKPPKTPPKIPPKTPKISPAKAGKYALGAAGLGLGTGYGLAQFFDSPTDKKEKSMIKAQPPAMMFDSNLQKKKKVKKVNKGKKKSRRSFSTADVVVSPDVKMSRERGNVERLSKVDSPDDRMRRERGNVERLSRTPAELDLIPKGATRPQPRGSETPVATASRSKPAKKSIIDFMFDKDNLGQKKSKPGEVSLFGYDIDVDTTDEGMDLDPDKFIDTKHGGKVMKRKKSSKTKKKAPRKRAALRGHRAELRGG